MNASVLFNPSQVRLIAREFEELSLGAASTPLDPAKAGLCFRAVIKTDGGGNLRYRIDGGTPSGTVGTPMYDGEQLELSHDDAVNFLAFRLGSINPTLHVIYLRP